MVIINKARLCIARCFGYHHKYGKLIGKSKNGITVFKNKFSESEEITSVQANGDIYKTVGIKSMLNPLERGQINFSINNYKTGITTDIVQEIWEASNTKAVTSSDRRLHHHTGATFRDLYLCVRGKKYNASITLDADNEKWRSIETKLTSTEKKPTSLFRQFYDSRRQKEGDEIPLAGKVSLFDKAANYIRKKQLDFAVKMGYHNEYGQLIGVDKKNGIAVFGDRINDSTHYIARITSFDKEGNKFKYIWTDGYAVNKKGVKEIELWIDNFKTGISTVISSKTKKADGKISLRSVKSEDRNLGDHSSSSIIRFLAVTINDKIRSKIGYFNTDNNKVVKSLESPRGKKIPKGFFDKFYNSRVSSQKK